MSIHLDGDPLPIKIGYRDGLIVQASVEYEDAAALAAPGQTGSRGCSPRLPRQPTGPV